MEPPHMQEGPNRVRGWLRSRWVDRIAIVVAWAIPLLSWRRSGELWERLADIRVPRSILMTTMIAALVGRRERERTSEELGRIGDELGALIGTSVRESEERSKELLAVQTSTERFAAAADKRDEWFAETQKRFLEIQTNMETLAKGSDRRDQRLLQLTVVVTVFGVLGTAAAIVALLR